MMTIICITILVYFIMGKDISELVKKVEDIDWRSKINNLWSKLQPYALKVGRTATRPLLQFYYVLSDEKTSTADRILIYAAIIYTISPVSILPVAVYRFLGVLDEGAAMMYVYKKIKDNITGDIERKVNDTLNEWFGVEYELIED